MTETSTSQNDQRSNRQCNTAVKTKQNKPASIKLYNQGVITTRSEFNENPTKNQGKPLSRVGSTTDTRRGKNNPKTKRNWKNKYENRKLTDNSSIN